MRRTFQLSKRHDDLLQLWSVKLDISLTETVQRAIEALQEKEIKREKELRYEG